jgi:HEAT repeat protein
LTGFSVAGRAGAARTLGLLGAVAAGAVTDLVALLQDSASEVREQASQALVRIDVSRAGPAIPHLITCLESNDAGVRLDAVTLLGQMGRTAEPALPALRQALNDGAVSLAAAHAMVAIDAAQAADAVPLLMAALGQHQSQELLVALGRIGTQAAAAAPLMVPCLRDQDSSIRLSAANALLRVAPEETTDAIQTLLNLVTDVQDPMNVMIALDSLAEMGPAVRAVVPGLEQVLFNEETRRLWDPGLLFTTLIKIDPTATARVIGQLQSDSQTPERFDKAVSLLTDIAREIPLQSAPLLARLLKDSRTESQWDALLNTLASLGPQAKDAVPLLRDQLADASSERAARINAVLERIQ